MILEMVGILESILQMARLGFSLKVSLFQRVLRLESVIFDN